MLQIDDHPLLDLAVLRVELPGPLAELVTPPEIASLLRAEARGPLHADDTVRKAVRDLLRLGGYKPTGRGKPASEYLAKAAEEGTLAPINAVVDVGNAASLHSGLPISVVDAGQVHGALRVELGKPGERYVFNAAGHDIDVEGLLCLRDADGPCANAVKDAQRTKTSAGTRHLLVLVWGTRAIPDRSVQTAHWLSELFTALGATVERT
jgi:DNA/RNA-binding domain of Phe-tRNA-synthetase-like protein